MALIQCSDCHADVSDRAPTCPKCGAPITTAAEVRDVGVAVTTTEETSKRLKKHIVFASVLIWGGLAVGCSLLEGEAASGTERVAGVVTMSLAPTVGFIWYIVTKMRIWWHHK